MTVRGLPRDLELFASHPHDATRVLFEVVEDELADLLAPAANATHFAASDVMHIDNLSCRHCQHFVEHCQHLAYGGLRGV